MRCNLCRIAVFVAVSLFASAGVGQTISPPIAEYRGKAQGMFELRNDGDVPMAAILEVNGFTVDENGALTYKPLDPTMKVELGANSFIIPPHQSHLVFYKASSTNPQAWFAVLNTLTRATNQVNQMRINFILPHVVYLYQKQKLKKDDVAVKLVSGAKSGEYQLEVQNVSAKLGRVEAVSTHGFEKNAESGGFPLFPASKRYITLSAGAPGNDATVKVSFEDGFSVQVPFSPAQ